MQVIQQIFSNPLWTFIIGAIVAVIMQVIFHNISKRRRDLVYSDNPVRARIVRSQQATDLKVLYRDEPLGDIDVTAVQLAIWNAGNESIKPEHIRKEIVVTTKPQVRILEASVRNYSPDTGFELLDTTDSKINGRVPLSWKILEKNEGASIQLLYIGTSEVNILVEGLIEGQGRAKRIVTSSSFKSLQEYRKSRRNRILWLAISLFVAVAIAILYFVYNLDVNEIVSTLFIFSLFNLFFALLGFSSTIREQFPPFGF